MDTVLVALLSFGLFLLAYGLYGGWLARRVFALDPRAAVPSQVWRDDVDYVPTRRSVVFGHHFTSIAGTGPIVGPAIAVFWGWLPAVLWVVFGAIFIGAVHDFGALVVSLRNEGQSVGEVAGRLISPRTRLLFLSVLFFALTVVLAIFGLVIANIFTVYPESVLSVWAALPIAIAVGVWNHRGGRIGWMSVAALVLLYVCVWVGVYVLPISLESMLGIPTLDTSVHNAVVYWTLLLFVYCFFASVLPVWLLLQPRDYVNSHQLLVALALLVFGMLVAGVTGRAHLTESAPAIAARVPHDAPPIWPFLFVTIACGAVSGFHCLVSSGTSSKQLACEPDARYVGYGAMLLEGVLAVVVILACTAGVGMGLTDADGRILTGRPAWESRYQVDIVEVTMPNGDTETTGGWENMRLRSLVAAFVEGGANFLAALRIPRELSVAVIAVLVACFAATTLDTATRLQRYIIQELASTLHVRPLQNKYTATLFALLPAAGVALWVGERPGAGGFLLWPLFGATNQVLAGLSFMVIVFYLWRRNKPVMFAILPMLLMLLIPSWALLWQMFSAKGWLAGGKYALVAFGAAILLLQGWMVIEAIVLWPRAKGVLESPARLRPPVEVAASGGGR